MMEIPRKNGQHPAIIDPEGRICLPHEKSTRVRPAVGVVLRDLLVSDAPLTHSDIYCKALGIQRDRIESKREVKNYVYVLMTRIRAVLQTIQADCTLETTTDGYRLVRNNRK